MRKLEMRVCGSYFTTLWLNTGGKIKYIGILR